MTIPSLQLWVNLVGHTGEKRAALVFAVISCTARVAVEDTRNGLCFSTGHGGRPILSLRLRALPGGMLPPVMGDRGTIEEILRHERLELVRHVTICGRAKISSEVGWWLHREGTALPLALEFLKPVKEIDLPNDAFSCRIIGLSISCVWNSNTLVLDIAKHRNSLTALRGFAVGNNWSPAQLKSLEVLATLGALKLFASHSVADGDVVARWVGQCPSLCYLFCVSWGALARLDDVAKAPSLISIVLMHCDSITDLTPLMQLDSLQCLVVRRCDAITGYEGLHAPGNIRVLAVQGWPNDLALPRACNNLDWLEVSNLAEGVTSVDGLAGAAPFAHHFSLIACNDLDHLLLSALDRLTSPCVTNCSHLVQIDVSALPNLSELTVSSCQALESLILSVSTKTVSVSWCDALTALDASMCTMLASVAIISCAAVKSLTLGASPCKIIVQLCNALAALDLSMCVAVKMLALHACQTLRHFQPPTSFTTLEKVVIEGPLLVRKLDLRTATHLQKARVLGCGSLEVLYPHGFQSHTE